MLAADDRLELITIRGGRLFVSGPWPARVLISSDTATRFMRRSSEDLVDIGCENGRGIYRLTAFDHLRRRWTGELVYQELDELEEILSDGR